MNFNAPIQNCFLFQINAVFSLFIACSYQLSSIKQTLISSMLCIFNPFFMFPGLYLLSGCGEGEVCVGNTFSLGELYIFIGKLMFVVLFMLCCVVVGLC
jgi:hypothetical protein